MGQGVGDGGADRGSVVGLAVAGCAEAANIDAPGQRVRLTEIDDADMMVASVGGEWFRARIFRGHENRASALAGVLVGGGERCAGSAIDDARLRCGGERRLAEKRGRDKKQQRAECLFPFGRHGSRSLARTITLQRGSPIDRLGPDRLGH